MVLLLELPHPRVFLSPGSQSAFGEGFQQPTRLYIQHVTGVDVDANHVEEVAEDAELHLIVRPVSRDYRADSSPPGYLVRGDLSGELTVEGVEDLQFGTVVLESPEQPGHR